MKKALAGILLIAAFALGSPCGSKAQVAPECSNCANAEWYRMWDPTHQACVNSPSAGCGNGCTCWMGLMVTKEVGLATSVRVEFFGGAFIRDAKGVVLGFRIDRPGPLARNHVAPGDVVYFINGQRPRRSHFGTQRHPIRSAEATWDSRGQLRLRLRT